MRENQTLHHRISGVKYLSNPLLSVPSEVSFCNETSSEFLAYEKKFNSIVISEYVARDELF